MTRTKYQRDSDTYSRYLNTAKDIMSRAEHWKQSHEMILTKMRMYIYDDKAYQKLPGYFRYRLSGYIDCIFDQTWYQKTEGQSYDLELEKWIVTGPSYHGPWSLPDGSYRFALNGRQVWKGTDSVYFQSEE